MREGGGGRALVVNDDAGPPSVTFASGLSWTRVRLPRLLSRIGKACFLAGAVGALGMVFPFPAVFGLVERRVAGGVVPTLEIELTNGDRLTARSPDLDAPHTVARALGFGPAGKRVHTSLAKPTRRLIHPLLGLVAYVASLGAAMGFADYVRPGGNEFDVAFAAYPLVTLLLYAALGRLVRAPEVTVGDDGVLVKGLLRSHFIAGRDIAFVSAGPDSPDGTLAIEERSGKRVAVVSVLLDEARLAAVSRLVGELASPRGPIADRFAHYDRAGRPLAAWRDHLAHAMNDSSYRQNAATVDEAASVLRSAEATPEQRVGAALALRVAGQPRERIRVAVEGAADDRMREALEAVADADDDVVIEKALKRLQP